LRISKESLELRVLVIRLLLVVVKDKWSLEDLEDDVPILCRQKKIIKMQIIKTFIFTIIGSLLMRKFY